MFLYFFFCTHSNCSHSTVLYVWPVVHLCLIFILLLYRIVCNIWSPSFKLWIAIHSFIFFNIVFITEEDPDIPDLKDLMKKKKRVFEAPRAQNYYHLEYYLLPDDIEPIKTDVVTYGIAAKIYMERHDPRVLKTWQDGEVTWVAWTHRWDLPVCLT